MTLIVRMGPTVTFQAEAGSLTEITKALEDFKRFNRTVGEMFGDLTKLVYPDYGDSDAASKGKDKS